MKTKTIDWQTRALDAEARVKHEHTENVLLRAELMWLYGQYCRSTREVSYEHERRIEDLLNL